MQWLIFKNIFDVWYFTTLRIFISGLSYKPSQSFNQCETISVFNVAPRKFKKLLLG